MVLSIEKRQLEDGCIYQVLTDNIWNDNTSKFVTEIVATLGKDSHISPTAVLWSDSHTVGHLFLDKNDPLIPKVPLKSQGKIVLPCELHRVGKFRNGSPRWWCRTHQIHYGVKEDIARGYCRNADVELRYARNPFTLTIEDYVGGIGIWAALPPFISINRQSTCTKHPHPILGIHVHCREEVEGKKRIDSTFPVIALPIPDSLNISHNVVYVSQPAALAYLVSCEMQLSVETLQCNHCGSPHCDLGFFAQDPHKVHLCGNCGRMFKATKEPSISNPLVEISRELERIPRKVIEAQEHLDIQSSDYPFGIEIWTTTPAILWLMDRPEVVNGIHVHCYSSQYKRAIDETYKTITLDGEFYDRERLLGDFLERYRYKRPQKKNMFIAHPDDH